ncbi:MAG: methyl-accepting chemotaxis protein [Bacillus sp. (in: firmicutes)]
MKIKKYIRNEFTIQKRLLVLMMTLLIATVGVVSIVAVNKSKEMAVELMQQRLEQEVKATYVMAQNMKLTYISDEAKFHKKMEQVVRDQDANFLKDNINGSYYLITNQEADPFNVNKKTSLKLPDDVMKEIIQQETGVLQKRIKGKKYSIAFQRIQEMKGIYVIILPQEEYLQKVNDIKKIVLLVSILSICITMVIIVYFVRSIVKPLTILRNWMREVREGNLLVHPNIKTSIPEIKSLVNSYTTMIDRMKLVLSEMKSTSSQLSNTGNMIQEQSTFMKEKNVTLSEIISIVKQGANETAVSSEATIGIFQEMKDKMEQVVLRMNDMNKKTTVMNEAAQIGEQNIKDLFHSFDSLQNQFLSITNTILKVKKHSQSIGTIIHSIRGLAEQTKLLALNASLEAARAGQNGLGFAVVANEVRNLAILSSNASEEIKTFTNEMDLIADDATEDIEKITTEFAHCEKHSKKSSKSFDQLLQGIDSVNNGLVENQDQLFELQTLLPKMENSSLYLTSISQQTLASSDEMAAIAEMQQEEVQINADISVKLAQLVESLENCANQYKLHT